MFEYKAKGGHNGRLSGVVIHLSRIVVEWAEVMEAVVIFLYCNIHGIKPATCLYDTKINIVMKQSSFILTNNAGQKIYHTVVSTRIIFSTSCSWTAMEFQRLVRRRGHAVCIDVSIIIWFHFSIHFFPDRRRTGAWALHSAAAFGGDGLIVPAERQAYAAE